VSSDLGHWFHVDLMRLQVLCFLPSSSSLATYTNRKRRFSCLTSNKANHQGAECGGFSNRHHVLHWNRAKPQNRAEYRIEAPVLSVMCSLRPRGVRMGLAEDRDPGTTKRLGIVTPSNPTATRGSHGPPSPGSDTKYLDQLCTDTCIASGCRARRRKEHFPPRVQRVYYI